MFFAGEAALNGVVCGASFLALGRRGRGGFAEELRESLPGDFSVCELAAFVGCGDGECSVVESVGEAVVDSLFEVFGDGGAVGEVEG